MYLIYSAGQQSITKTPMNLPDRLNGIYSARSEVPINWLVASRRDALDLFPPAFPLRARFSNGRRGTR